MPNLSYKDCLRLKDAGFPQSAGLSYWYTRRESMLSDTQGVTTRKELDYENGRFPSIEDLIACPNTDEIIEALGERFERLHISDHPCLFEARSKGKYFRLKRKGKIEDVIEIGRGKTPLEAVKNLYLALNEKETE